MTRRRRVPLVLRVCIGTCLLLFSASATDTVKGPPINLENVATDVSDQPSVSIGNETAVNKIPSKNEADLTSSGSDKGAIGSYNSTKKDLEGVHSELSKDAKAEEEEKVPIPIDKDFNAQGTRSHVEVDRLSTSDSTNGGSRFEETLYGTLGKSTSTKTISEDFTRLSRTNDLATVTTKPSLDDSKLEDKKNKTVSADDTSYQEANQTTTIELTEEQETDTKGELGHLSKESSVNSALKSKKLDFVSESATQKAFPPDGFQERRKKSENLSVKNSEVPDLKEADDNKESGGPISLINDTYVNYYKTTTEKNLETDLGNQSRAHENATNFISENSAVTHEPPDPKGDVEVVGNVTHDVIERIVEQQSENLTVKEAGTVDQLVRSNRDEDSTYNSSKTVETGHVDEEGTNEKNQQKLNAATEKSNIEETSTLQATSSPVPRGRTIAFSGINEFPSLETKPTLASKMDILISKKNISTDKLMEQKPYPYIKSSVKEEVHNSSNRVVETTEETSALENTIGRGQLEEKYIDTEPSVVLENSIQQFKPTFYEKPENGSSNNATVEPRPSVPITTMSLVTLEEARPTNQTAVDEADVPKTIAKAEEKSTSTGNDVARGGESREVITEKGNFDVTGNGITEVSLKSESADKRTYEPSFREIANRTTAAPLTMEPTDKPRTDVGRLSNADVQTNAEDSLLIRSTLNATELSTEYPLIKGNFTETEKLTIPITSLLTTTTVKSTNGVTAVEETPTGNVTESPAIPDLNGTNEIPSSGSGTFEPNETFLPSTTSIEYEFVGLSETTTLASRNVTEETPIKGKPSNGTLTTVPTVQDLSTTNSSDDITTISLEMVTDNSSSVGETETTNIDTLSTIPVTDQTIVPTMMPNLTTQPNDELTTQPSTVAETTEETSTKKVQLSVVTDSWTTTSDEDVATTVKMEQWPTSATTKDSPYFLNVTEVSTVATSMVNATVTDVTKMATSTPFVPFTLQPRIPVSSTPNTRTASDIPMETTDDTKVPMSSEDITSLVRIDMEASWDDVCQQKESLRATLAEIFRIGLNRSVQAKQIIFHQDVECPVPPSSTPTPSDMPLTSILVYVVDENGKFNSTMTNILPTLYEEYRGHMKFPITIHSFLLVQETIPDSGNAIAVVVVSSVAFLCLVLLAGLLFIMRKRQTRFNYGERCRPVSLDAYSLDSVSAYNSVRRKGVARSSKRSYGNPTFEDSSAIPSHPLNFAGLSSFCNDVNAINEEFAGIPQVSAKIDELPSGAEVKNRYANVIPLPETRVPLQKVNNDPLSEYINASYVRGPKNATRYYIACQAPMEATVTDFWTMIWEQQCKVVIMLTDLIENGVEKCTEYIPPSEITDCHRLYGDYQVTLKKRETKEKYAISTLHLKNLENNTFREVYHIWYLWPVNGVQSDGAGLIAVLLEARALQRGGPGPIVVHCSPGTGRTGTLIALDLGIRQYEITRTVDVPRVVYTIRRDRAGAVQTKEQYAFIYKALNLYATKLAGGVLEST